MWSSPLAIEPIVAALAMHTYAQSFGAIHFLFTNYQRKHCQELEKGHPGLLGLPQFSQQHIILALMLILPWINLASVLQMPWTTARCGFLDEIKSKELFTFVHLHLVKGVA